MAFILSLVFLVAPPELPPDDAKSFEQLITARLSDIKDVEFTYSATTRFARPDRQKSPDRRYRGTYAFRSDGAAGLVLNRMALSGDPLSKTTMAINPLPEDAMAVRRWQLETSFVPARRAPVGLPYVGPGAPGCFMLGGSPECFEYLWYFKTLRMTRPDLDKLGYKSRGWEQVDGHRCLTVDIELNAIRKGEWRSFRRFWIDLERGGHPLKIELYDDARLVTRCDKIELFKVNATDGKPVWFPVAAAFTGFSLPQTTRYSVDASTIRINQNLKDERFTLVVQGRSD